ncbi:MAG: succinate dehydrogenase assembly factor 2 [Burkholderiaceae bacterium]
MEVDAPTLNRLKWRCRRGLLENDLFVERFFARHESSITAAQVRGLQALMDLADKDLLDLFLSRSEPAASLSGDARDVLQQVRTAPPQAAAWSTRIRA